MLQHHAAHLWGIARLSDLPRKVFAHLCLHFLVCEIGMVTVYLRAFGEHYVNYHIQESIFKVSTPQLVISVTYHWG